MIVITSPAKTLDFGTGWESVVSSQPRCLDQSTQLVDQIKLLRLDSLQSFLGVSENLAQLNHERFQQWNRLHSKDTNSKPAVLAYDGDIYRQFAAAELDSVQQQYLQSHLRIISGLYGLLRPYDLIRPYRLEFKSKLERLEGIETDNLYKFWGDTLAELLVSDLKASHGDQVLINLASNEYWRAVKMIAAPVIQVEFRQRKQGVLKNYGIYAKQARGLMIGFMVNHQIDDVSGLKGFDVDGYELLDQDDSKLVFVKGID